jgi:Flp pilus assembly protein TadG
MNRWNQSKSGRLRGQSLIEFAIAFPLFVLMLMAMIDLCRYYFMEQSISHTLRSTGRYAVTGQLANNSNYQSTNSNSWPYLQRRQTLLMVAQSNNPGNLTITAGATNETTNDNFTIESSDNFNGPWSTNSTGGTDSYIKLCLTNNFYFVTPFLDLVASTLNSSQPLRVGGELIMKDESFSTNLSTATNGSGATTNYWN